MAGLQSVVSVNRQQSKIYMISILLRVTHRYLFTSPPTPLTDINGLARYPTMHDRILLCHHIYIYIYQTILVPNFFVLFWSFTFLLCPRVRVFAFSCCLSNVGLVPLFPSAFCLGQVGHPWFTLLFSLLLPPLSDCPAFRRRIKKTSCKRYRMQQTSQVI